jgi:hypothetical protein
MQDKMIYISPRQSRLFWKDIRSRELHLESSSRISK